jgi:hypothetical protein
VIGVRVAGTGENEQEVLHCLYEVIGLALGCADHPYTSFLRVIRRRLRRQLVPVVRSI